MQNSIKAVNVVVKGVNINNEGDFFHNLRWYGFYGCHTPNNLTEYSVEIYDRDDFSYANEEELTSIYADALKFMADCVNDGFTVELKVVN